MTSDNTRCVNYTQEDADIEADNTDTIESSSNEHTNVCKCGHEKENHNIYKKQYKVEGCCVIINKDTRIPCPCNKFEVENEIVKTPHGNFVRLKGNKNRAPEPRDNVSKCCNANFIEDSDICSKCKEHSE